MQSVSENLYRRGKRGTYYLRRRIPTPLRDAYPPGKVEISCSLRTSDYGLAKQRLHAQMSAVDAQFERQKIGLLAIGGRGRCGRDAVRVQGTRPRARSEPLLNAVSASGAPP